MLANLFEGEIENGKFGTQFEFPRDVYIVMLICILIIVVKNLFIFPTADFLIERLDTENKLGFGKRKKFRVAFWKAVFYFSTSTYGHFTLKNEHWVDSFRDIAGSWYPDKVPNKILFYYYLEFSYYFVELFYLFSEHTYKDFWQMFIHHIITLELIVSSYFRNFLRYGVVIMAIHDISDPFLEICKLINYVYDSSLTTIMFICFMFVFIISRIGVYSFLVAIPAAAFIWKQKFEPVLHSIIPMLYGLIVMHIIWSYMIIRMAIRVASGSKPEDSRSIRTDNTKPKPENLNMGKS